MDDLTAGIFGELKESSVTIDLYRRNRRTGSFIAIDETTNATVLAGMIRL